MKNAKESSCCEGKDCTHCWVRVLLVFLLGALVGGVTVGLLFFYEVLTPSYMETSTFRDYRAAPTQVELKTVEPGQFDIRGFIPPTGTMEDPMSFIPPTGT